MSGRPDPDMIDRRLRECDALGARPSPAVLHFAGVLSHIGLTVEIDPMNHTVTAAYRGLRKKLAWKHVDSFVIPLEDLAMLVRREMVEAAQ